MTSKPLPAILIAGATIIALMFLKLMFDMNRSIAEMTAHMGAMSQDVREMNGSMHAMRNSLGSMQKSVEEMGQAFGQGGEQLKQWNPAGMMQQVLPGSGQRSR